MEQPGVVAGHFAVSFSINFLSIFVHISGSIRPITLIWASLQRSFPPAEVEYRWCQFWSKVMTSEVEERPRLVKANYRRHRSQWINSRIAEENHFFVTNLKLLHVNFKIQKSITLRNLYKSSTILKPPKVIECCRLLINLQWKEIRNWMILYSITLQRLLCKKGIYRFLADFHYLQDWANFWQTDLFWHEKHRSIIVFANLHFVLQKKRVQKTSVLQAAPLWVNLLKVDFDVTWT